MQITSCEVTNTKNIQIYLTEEELQKHQVSDELIKEFINNLIDCEFARYAPGNQDEKMDKIYSSAIDVISKMENSIKR